MIKKILIFIILIILCYDLYNTWILSKNYQTNITRNKIIKNDINYKIPSDNSSESSDDNSSESSDDNSSESSDDNSSESSDDNSSELSDDTFNKLTDDNLCDLTDTSVLNNYEYSKEHIKHIEQPTGQREQSIGQREQSIGQREQSIGQREQPTGQREQSIGQREQSIGQRDQSTGQIDQSIGQRDQFIEQRDQSIGQRDQFIEQRDQFIEQRDQPIKQSIEQIDINQYGKPYNYKKNEFIHWEFYEPKPWTKIIYIYNDNYPYNYHIKANIPSLNDYQAWKKIITNLDFNPKSGELIIPCKDEDSALSIANIIISNFKGDITLDEIINKDLIGVSIMKAKKYEVVKNKLREQIIQNIITPSNSSNSFNDLNKKIEIIHSNKNKKKINTDDVNINNNNYFYYDDGNNNNNIDLNPYDGLEFSFI